MRYEAMFPRVADVGCSWGEIRDRADLIVLWRPMGVSRLPRFAERFIEPARRRGAKVITVESRFDADDVTVLWLMRSLVRGRPLAASPRIIELAEEFKAAHYGVIGYSPRGPFTVALRALVQELNRDGRRFRCVPLGGYHNSAGERQATNWQTGYAGEVSFHRGHPAHCGTEFSDHDVGHEFDVHLSVSTGHAVEGVDLGPLAEFPTITVRSRLPRLPNYGQVIIATSIPGIHTSGTVFRGDGVALPLRPAFSTSLPDPTEVFRRLTQAVRARRP